MAPEWSARLFRIDRRRCRGPAFTLIEVLVVVSIIALLIAILIPSLSQAKYQSRLAACGSNLHQLGLAITSYAHTHRTIPYGPEVAALAPYLEANDGTLATNQIWTGPQQPLKRRMAHGLLLTRSGMMPQMMYCPGDDSNDPQEELDKITKEKIAPAYSSYLYRQLQETNRTGLLQNLGENTHGGLARALAMDINSLITVDPSFRRTNHGARDVNVLYADCSVRHFDNRNNAFSIMDEHLADTKARRAEMLQAADKGY